jgi:hypothetical protein
MATKTPDIPPPRKPQYFPQQADYYRFYSPVEGKEFYALRGDSAPTVTGGYGKWNTIDRPRRTGLTVFAGYDPITMDIPVRFEAYLGEKSGFDVENDIQALEYLAGRGVKAANSQKDKTPPYVAISSFNAAGSTVYVLGNNYTFDDDDNPNPPNWVITGVQWDGDVLFNRNGRRLRQTATITLTQYVKPSAGKFGTHAARGPKTATRHATAKLDTMSKLAKAWHNTKADVRKLNTSHHLEPYVRDFSKRIPKGTAVKLYVK